MSEEFVINPPYGAIIRQFFHSQFFGTPTYPTKSFANQTVVVTGSNVGLGLEAARHVYRLDAAKVILAVRTVKKGEAAKENIVGTVKHRSDGSGAVEVWPLDLTSTASTLAFAEKAKSLPRLDVVIENAGVVINGFRTSEGFEEVIQVNVLNTLLLAMALLPKLKETKHKFPESLPHLEIVSSDVHYLTKMRELNAPDLYAKLNDKSTFDQNDRYNISKALEVLFIRELVSRLGDDKSVVIDLVNPGLCWSELDRNNPLPLRVILFLFRSAFARSTEVGSRTLVHGAIAGQSSHGEFMCDGHNQPVAAWIPTDMGKKAQVKVFEQTMKILEARKPGIGKEAGL
ncbi:uncharacterized protein A1O9_08654 [Exophiala aquamarina CBS 119918]|uniref:Alcohol dehydrogenase n=1 Tax=Exophiala aquamarina CBS 119918 TaxID=1182545 RepID=A0A072P5K3_9EURO|nr:uncharacterized protein A1O9_08654 [Exophiala aquamarina CBS 119918]KEF55002.1 hypothetical protein A1O9_08654 [Exophiala aquamarina CBS 119918]